MSEALVVTSDDEWRVGLRNSLVCSGRRVHEAATVAGLRAVLSRVTPELVIVDYELVGASAPAWASELRARAPGVSILLLVAASLTSEAEAELLADGVSEILRKPISPGSVASCAARLAGADAEVPPSKSPGAAPVQGNQPFEELQRAYRARLSERLSELETALSAARAAGPGSLAFRRAQTLSHHLRGSAGSYGLRVVSSCAAEIEDQLHVLERGCNDAASPWSAISHALTRASGHFDQAEHCMRPSRALSPGLRLLVLDDDPDCRQLVALLGRAASLNVFEAANSAEALSVALREPLDVALVDLHLGQQDDATGAIAELRLRVHPLLPIVAFSADTSVENRLAAVHAGADAFLAKPVNADELALAVRRLAESGHSEPHRVLVVDDDPSCAASLARLLTLEGWHASTLLNTSNIFEALDNARPDLLLLDVMMPVDGFDICRIVRASPAWRELAIVFVTGATDPDTLVRCYEAGGDDYICKPVVPEELRARLRLRLTRARVFRQLAHEDALTGLLTREAFSTSVARRVAEAMRHSRTLSIVMLDLDRFKYVNDQHGHMAGDRVLRALGNLLKRRFRVEDFRGRWGGEEFVMALADTTVESTAHALERALDDFRGLVFEGDCGELFCCSFSAGVAQLPDDGTSLSALMQCADARLYAAKAAGRSRVISIPPSASLRLAPKLEHELAGRASGTYPASTAVLVRVKL